MGVSWVAYLSLLGVLCAGLAVGQVERYIDVNLGSDMNNCTSEVFPCASVRGAVDSLDGSGFSALFWLSPGIYSGNRNVNFQLPSISLSMTSNSKEAPIFDCNSENDSIGFYTNRTTLSLDGITVRNCKYGIGYTDMDVISLNNVVVQTMTFGVSASSLTANNVTFENNTQAILSKGESLTVTTTQFINCYAAVNGNNENIHLSDCLLHSSGNIQLESNFSTTLDSCIITEPLTSTTSVLQAGDIGEITISNSQVSCSPGTHQTVTLKANTNMMNTTLEGCFGISWQGGSLSLVDSQILGADSPVSSIGYVESLNIVHSEISGPSTPVDVPQGIIVSANSVNLHASLFTGTSFSNLNTSPMGAVSNCTFMDSTKFSLSVSGTWDILNSSFVGNNPFSGDASAIKLPVQSNLTLTNSNFVNAASDSGSVLSGRFGALTIESCVFMDNLALSGTGAVIYSTIFESITIQESYFTGNQASYGALYLADNNGSAYISASEFDSNVATSGGAIYSQTNLFVSNNSFTSNTATNNGGAIYSTLFHSLSVDGCTFTDNSATFGGAIAVKYLDNDDDTPVNVDIAFSTFTSNSVTEGGDGSVFACIDFDGVSFFTFSFDDSNSMVDNEGNEIDCGASFPWGLLIGICISVVGFVVLLALGIYYCWHKKRKSYSTLE